MYPPADFTGTTSFTGEWHSSTGHLQTRATYLLPTYFEGLLCASRVDANTIHVFFFFFFLFP